MIRKMFLYSIAFVVPWMLMSKEQVGLTIQNRMNTPIQMCVITKRLQPSNSSRSGFGESNGESNIHVRQSERIFSDIKHGVHFASNEIPVALLLQGTYPLKQGFKVKKRDFVSSAQFDIIDTQNVPPDLLAPIEDIGNEKLALIQFRTKWFEKHKSHIMVHVNRNGKVDVKSF